MIHQVLHDGIAGGQADHRQMIVIRRFGLVGRSARHALFILIAVQVHRQQKLALAVLATDPPCALFSADQHRQYQGGENRNDGNYDQQFYQSERGRGSGIG